MSFSYRKFPDGSWTIVGSDTLAPGTVATVTTRNGKTKTETVRERLLTLEDGRHVYRVEPRKTESKTMTNDNGLLYAAKIALEYIDAWMAERKYPDTAEAWCIKYNDQTPDVVYAQRDRVRAAIAKAESGK